MKYYKILANIQQYLIHNDVNQRKATNPQRETKTQKLFGVCVYQKC